MENGITAILIVKDEAKTLARCIRSLSGLSEIVVLDTGSTDGTVGIAGSLGAKIAVPWEPIVPFHFAEARNRALSHVRTPWAFTIDADEVLRPGGIRKMRKAIQEAGDKTAFVVTFINQPETAHGSPNRTYVTRKVKLFRKDACEWRYRIHEQLFDKAHDCLVQNVPGMVGDLSAVSIEHLPAPDKSRRHGQNIELLKLCVKENPEYTRAFRHLGQELMREEKWEEAIPYLYHYVDKTDEGPLEASVVMERIGFCIGNLGRLEEAIVWFERAGQVDPRRREPLYWAAQYLMHAARSEKGSEKVERAVRCLERVLQIPVGKRPGSPNDCLPAWGNEPKRLLTGYRKALEDLQAQKAVN